MEGGKEQEQRKEEKDQDQDQGQDQDQDQDQERDQDQDRPTSRSDRIYKALWHDRLVLSDLCGNYRGLVIIPPRAVLPSLKLHLPRFP